MTGRSPKHVSDSQIFLVLILAQAAHSIEEFRFRLYDVLAPARMISEAIGPDKASGFLLANAALVAGGLACWIVADRRGGSAARILMGAWVLLEIANGLNHCLLALRAGGYFPGLATAPLLLIMAAWLGRRLVPSRS